MKKGQIVDKGVSFIEVETTHLSKKVQEILYYASNGPYCILHTPEQWVTFTSLQSLQEVCKVNDIPIPEYIIKQRPSTTHQYKKRYRKV